MEEIFPLAVILCCVGLYFSSVAISSCCHHRCSVDLLPATYVVLLTALMLLPMLLPLLHLQKVCMTVNSNHTNFHGFSTRFHVLGAALPVIAISDYHLLAPVISFVIIKDTFQVPCILCFCDCLLCRDRFFPCWRGFFFFRR